MARAAGESTLGTISLEALNNAFKDFPKIKVKISKGWVKQVEAALGVTLPIEEEAAKPAAPAESEAVEAAA